MVMLEVITIPLGGDNKELRDFVDREDIEVIDIDSDAVCTHSLTETRHVERNRVNPAKSYSETTNDIVMIFKVKYRSILKKS